MLRSSATGLLLFLSLPRMADANEVGPWETVVEKDGITVKRRSIGGSSLKEFQGRGMVEEPLSAVLALLLDSSVRHEWSAKCVESRLIAQVEPRAQLIYDRTDAPWPVSDRDTVLLARTAVDLNARELRIQFVNVKDARQPPVAGVVRMPLVEGHWVLRPAHGGAWTDTEYQVHADPGGALPDWLSNLVSKQVPLKTLQQLRAQMKKRRYPEVEATIKAQPDYQALMGSPTPQVASPQAAPVVPVAH